MAKIQDLPNELLLDIALRIGGRYRNSNLSNLALVSHQFRPIAQEALLQEPCLKLANTHTFMLEMNRQSWVIPKIRCLELWSTNEGRPTKKLPDSSRSSHIPVTHAAELNLLLNSVYYTAVPCPPQLLADTNFMATCTDMIERSTSNFPFREVLWLKALREDSIPALLGVLLASLPNLKELRCAAVWLMDFPILAHILSPEVALVSPFEWKHKYLDIVMGTIKSKLEVLEVPTNDSHMTFTGQPSSLFNFRTFENMKELAISMEAIYYKDSRPRRPFPWPVPLLPPNLEILRISEGGRSTARFIEDLCNVKKDGATLRALKRIEVFFCQPYDYIIAKPRSRRGSKPRPSLVQIMRMKCSDAKLALSLYFPRVFVKTRDVNRSLWSLKKNGEMPQIEWETFLKEGDLDTTDDIAQSLIDADFEEYKEPEVDMSFDADGDVEMEKT